MIVGIVVLWAGYSAGLWGYCLIRGYCVTPANLLSWTFPKSKGGTAASQTAATVQAAPAGANIASQIPAPPPVSGTPVTGPAPPAAGGGGAGAPRAL